MSRSLSKTPKACLPSTELIILKTLSIFKAFESHHLEKGPGSNSKWPAKGKRATADDVDLQQK